MEKYDPSKIESKWQEKWANDWPKGVDFDKRPKHYHLVEFPYPSGYGLHVGHCMGYGASDAYCRMKRMQGYNVMYPMGWDAFGLPTENFAIKNNVKPQVITEQTIKKFKEQMQSLGYSFDWSREVNTTDPNYYRWTQWIFLQFYKHGMDNDGKLIEIADDDTKTSRLAFQAEMAINWCPSCKIGLANEEVIGGKCERCGSEVVKKMQKQWMLRITAYAERLIKDLETVDYLDKIQTQQINWIGRSIGSNVKFEIRNSKSETNLKSETQNSKQFIEVFTTRADTLFGCTYLVLSPEHKEIRNSKLETRNYAEVEEYINESKKKSDLERTELQKEKTGVKLEGIKAINPINNQEVDIWVADYVLASYGTGAVMAVPAHDERDFDFAKKYDIPIRQVITPLFKTTKGTDAVRENEPIERRKTVDVIVKHWNENKIFCLDWSKFNWKSFIIGGVDKGETSEEAARREVIEESGYQNIKSIKKLGFTTNDCFYAVHKSVNRCAISECFVVELADNKFIEPKEDDKKFHQGHWIDEKDVEQYVNLSNNKFFWNQYLHGEEAFVDYGVLMNSAEYDELPSEEAKKKITEKLKEIGSGDFSVNYKLRDWVFSRQHYWGEPIPIVYCANCAKTIGKKQETRNNNQTSGNITIIDGKEYMLVPVAEDQLPLTLPDVENYQPTNTGQSPLASIFDWVNIKCPKCGGDAKRETDTMPNWAGSSWYFLAYAMNNELRIMNYGNKENIFDNSQKELRYWLPVDLYNGGMEHTTLHLLYSRFWHKFLYDLKQVPTLEPYQKRIAHGIILGPDGRKMSKSFGNVINPDDIITQFGADTTRAYIMFIGPYDQESAWSMAGVQGVYRFLTRVFNNFEKVIQNHTDEKELLVKLNQTIAGVTEDLENFRLNTVVSKLMELNNAIEKTGKISKESYSVFLKLLFPVAPHLASELWEKSGEKSTIDNEEWPKPNIKYLVADQIEIAVQINGKVRDRIVVDSNISDDDLKNAALNSEKVKQNIDDREVIKIIVVPKKLVSIVVK